MMLPMVPRFRGLRRRQSNSSNDEPEPQSNMGNQNSTADDNHEPTDSEIFYPELYDVLKVRYLLRWKIIPEGLPVEIVDLIVDAAEYWPSIEATLDQKRIIPQDRDQVLVRTAPLCYDEKTLGSDSPKVLPHRTIHPCRKIVFSIASHDQGFANSGHGTFDGSYTWFDTEIVASEKLSTSGNSSIPERDADGVRFGHDHPLLLPSSHKLQANRAAVIGTQHYQITWHHLDNIGADSAEAEEIQHNQGRGRATLDGSQVRNLQIGDTIAVWGRARFGAWSNHVERLSVRVFWAV